MKKTISISALALTLMLSGGASFAFAEDGGHTSTPSPSPSTTENPKAIKGCSVITKDVDGRIKNFDTHKGAHYEQYTKIKARLDAFVVKAKAAGQNTTMLEAHLVVLNTKMQKFVTDYTAYQTALKDTKTATCGKSEGEFKTKVEGARTELKTVRADVEDIHNYLKDTIKVDLKALKPVKTTEPSASPEATEKPETTKK